MKSMTIHGLSEPLANRIEEKAKLDGTSLNKTIKRLLESALGLSPSQATNHKDDFQEFVGVWTEEEQQRFNDEVASFRKIDLADWE